MSILETAVQRSIRLSYKKFRRRIALDKAHKVSKAERTLVREHLRIRSVTQYRAILRRNGGRLGFDAGNKTQGACRDGSQSRKSKATNL